MSLSMLGLKLKHVSKRASRNINMNRAFLFFVVVWHWASWVIFQIASYNNLTFHPAGKHTTPCLLTHLVSHDIWFSKCQWNSLEIYIWVCESYEHIKSYKLSPTKQSIIKDMFVSCGVLLLLWCLMFLQMVGKLGYAVRNMIYHGQFCIYFNLMTYNIGFHNKIWSYYYY